MSWVKTESGRYIFLLAVVVTATAASLFFMAPSYSNAEGAETAAVAGPAPSFPGVGVGAIPDGTSPCWNPGTSAGGPRDVTFNVTGLTGSPTSVAVNATFGSPNHTFMGDVTAILIAPN